MLLADFIKAFCYEKLIQLDSFLEILVTLEGKDFHFSNTKFARSVILLTFEIVCLGQI